MPISVAAVQQQQQQQASQLMKRPLTVHNDTAHTALQLFSQQPSSGNNPHEHDTMHHPNKQLILII